VEDVLGWYEEDYVGWAFVEARAEAPQISHVANTNRARLSAAVDRRPGSSCSSRRWTIF
jgi:N-acetyl-gamma-glutamyl-phosphate reductase